MLKKIYFISKNFILDLLFPRACIGCGAEGSWVCSDCLKTVDIIREPFCPECRRPTRIGEFCQDCKMRANGSSPLQLDGIFICANFGEGILREAVHHFKYNYIFDIGNVLGKIMAGRLGNVECRMQNVERGRENAECRMLNVEIIKFDLVVPVPLHKKRFRERGFNQAEILSYELLQILTNHYKWGNIVLAKNILVRKKYTTPQAELGREERLENLKEVFEFVGATGSVAQAEGRANGSPLQGKNILLVDDITTTGATLEECAKALKQNGAKSIWGIVLAKGK